MLGARDGVLVAAEAPEVVIVALLSKSLLVLVWGRWGGKDLCHPPFDTAWEGTPITLVTKAKRERNLKTFLRSVYKWPS